MNQISYFSKLCKIADRTFIKHLRDNPLLILLLLILTNCNLSYAENNDYVPFKASPLTKQQIVHPEKPDKYIELQIPVKEKIIKLQKELEYYESPALENYRKLKNYAAEKKARAEWEAMYGYSSKSKSWVGNSTAIIPPPLP